MPPLGLLVQGDHHVPFPPAQGMHGMIGDADHMKIVPAPDTGHVVLGGEKMVIESRQGFRQLQLDGKSTLPRLSGDDDIHLHVSPSGMIPLCLPLNLIPVLPKKRPYCIRTIPHLPAEHVFHFRG